MFSQTLDFEMESPDKVTESKVHAKMKGNATTYLNHENDIFMT
jgi:hypothetical protein